MPEKETVEVKEMVLVNPFQTLKVPPQEVTDPGQHLVMRATKMEVDPDTHQTHPVFEPFDLQKEIDSCKDLAGLDYMKKLLLTGQAKPEDFYDDGKSGVDTTVFPSTPHEARAEADKANDQLAEIAKALGVTDKDGVTAKTLEDILTLKVKQIYDAQVAAHQKKEGDAQ